MADQDDQIPVIKTADADESINPALARKLKRSINRGWRTFWEKRGIDPDAMRDEYYIRRGRKSTDPADDSAADADETDSSADGAAH
jgi:hypothetical protein